MRSTKWFAIALAGGLAFAGDVARADDDAVVSCCCANLDEVIAQPQAYLWTKFCFEGSFARMSEIYQPFFTRFDNYDYANFTAWDGRRDPKTKADFMESFPLLYVNRRSGDQIETVFCLKQFQRFRATAVVQNIFDGKPFIEVIDVVPIGCCCCEDGTTCFHIKVPTGNHCGHTAMNSSSTDAVAVATPEPVAAPSTPAESEAAPADAPIAVVDTTTDAPAASETPAMPDSAPADAQAPVAGG